MNLGSANLDREGHLPAFIAGYLPGLLRPGGVVASDREIDFKGARHLALPEGLVPEVYHLLRRPLA